MAMSEAQLRRECEDAWLGTAGSKAEVVARLVDSEKPRDGWVSAESELGPKELLRAFKRANPQVWAIKDEQVCRQFPVLPPLQQLLVMH